MLEVGKLAGLSGPIGAAAGGSGSPDYWVHASGRRSVSFGAAPLDGVAITPSTNWVTLTFNSDTQDKYDWTGNVFPYTNTDSYAVLEGIGLAIDDSSPDVGPYNIYIDSIYNGSTLIQGFEGHANGTYGIMFLRPGSSGTTAAWLSSPPDTNFVNNAAGVNSDTGTNSLAVQWVFKNESVNNWVRLYSGGTGTQYPQIDLHQPVTIRMLVLPAGQTVGRRFNGNVSFMTNSAPAFYTSGSNTLGVTVTGSGTYSYQWAFNGSDIFGATDASYIIEPGSGITSSDQGLYTVAVTDEGGGQIVRSVNAVIQNPAPSITNQPAGQIVHVGDNVTFSVGGDGHVAGGYPLTYQWKFNGVDIANATDATYPVSNAQVANAGSYTVGVSNVYDGILSSAAVLDVVQSGVVIGSGTGLRGNYFSSHAATNGSAYAFSGIPTLSRVDPTIDFNFGTGSPGAGISSDLFTVRWSGQVQALDTDTYTFYTRTDDGTRLWVNNQLLVNSWINQAPTEHSGTIALTANQQYPITMGYHENASGAVAQLSWSTAGGGVAKGIIPMSQLYPGSAGAPSQTLATTINGTDLTLNFGPGTYTLQAAGAVTGPYTNVAYGIVSPYTLVNAVGSGPMLFYRLQVQ